MPKMPGRFEGEIAIPFNGFELRGQLNIPQKAIGIVVFVHGSGSSRHSPRNQYVARILQDHGLGTLLFDLLTEAEELDDQKTGHLRFDIQLLSDRLIGATNWLHEKEAELQLGFFGSSTGGGAALVADSKSTVRINAIVSRGGRPDLAGPALAGVKAPTLFIVGDRDNEVIRLNRQALTQMRCEKELHLIPGAGHLFEEPGALKQVAILASDWFGRHLRSEA